MTLATLPELDPAISQRITELDPDPTPEQIQTFRQAGVGAVRGLIGTDEIDRLRDAFMQVSADGPVEGLSEGCIEGKPADVDEKSGDEADPLKRYPRMLHPHRRSDLEVGTLSLRYMLDRRITAVMAAVMGEKPLGAQSMFYFKPPGGRGQGLHQDNRPLAVNPGTCVAAWIPLDRCDSDNGALSVVPGSGPLHCGAETESRADIFFNGGSLKLPDGVEPVTAELERGDVLIFNGQAIHGSFPNRTTDRWRRTLIFHYAPESCEEIASFYHPLLDMEGNEVERRESPEGGPCGEFLSQPER